MNRTLAQALLVLMIAACGNKDGDRGPVKTPGTTSPPSGGWTGSNGSAGAAETEATAGIKTTRVTAPTDPADAVVGMWHELGTKNVWLITSKGAEPACNQTTENKYTPMRLMNKPIVGEMLTSQTSHKNTRGLPFDEAKGSQPLYSLGGALPSADTKKHMHALSFTASGNDARIYHAIGPIQLPPKATSSSAADRLVGLDDVMQGAAWKLVAKSYGLQQMDALVGERAAGDFLMRINVPATATNNISVGFAGRSQPMRRVADGVDCIGDELAPKPISYAGGGYATPAGATLEEVWPLILQAFIEGRSGEPPISEGEHPAPVETACTDKDGNTSQQCPATDVVPTAAYLRCTISKVDKFGARELGSRVLTGSMTALAPGVLVHASSLDKESFSEMQLKRPPWTLSLLGCEGGDRVAADADVSDFVHAHAKVSDLGKDCVFRPKSEYVYASADRTIADLMFQMGFKGAYAGFKGSLDTTLTKKYEKNTFRVLVATSYLTAAAARPPGDTFSAFGDKTEKVEGPQVISPYRFPVLLRTVTYGRLVYMNVVTTADSFSSDTKLTFSYGTDCASKRDLCVQKRDDGKASCDLLPECIAATKEIESGKCSSQECKSCQQCRLQVNDDFEDCLYKDGEDHKKCTDALSIDLNAKLTTLNSSNTDVLEAFVMGAGGTFSQDVLSGSTIEARRDSLLKLLGKHPTNFSDLVPMGVTGTYLDGSNDPAVYALPGVTTEHDDCQMIPAAGPTKVEPVKYSLAVYDVDDEVRVWETTGSAIGEPKFKLAEGYQDLVTLKENEEREYVIKLANSGCFDAHGTFILYRHGPNGKEEVWRDHEAPGWRHCNYTYRVRLRLKHEGVEIVTPSEACVNDWDCTK